MPSSDKNEQVASWAGITQGTNSVNLYAVLYSMAEKIGLFCKSCPPVSFVMSKFQKQNKKFYLCATGVSLGKGTIPLCKPTKKQGVLQWFLM